MTRSTVFAVACGVWFSGAVSAAALGYTMTRPLAPSTSTSTTWSQVSAGPHPGQEALANEAPYVLEIPVVTIVGRLAARAAAVASPVPRDIADMRCADWRELDIGSGRVQVCE